MVFIPPSGTFKKQDFSLQRIADWLKIDSSINTTLLYIDDNKNTFSHSFDKTIKVNSKQEIFEVLKLLSFDLIFNRSWMHSYEFSKDLIEIFDNVIVNIKDWNFTTKEEYQFLFTQNKDFEAIEYIFKHSKYILSHFTSEQALLWSEEYNVNKDKFIFFPEYCNENSFIDKQLEYKNIILAYAGKIHKSNLPEQLFPAKSHLRSIQKLTDKKIQVDFILPEKEYDFVVSHKDDFIDFLYENEFNEMFNLKKGKNLLADVLSTYHFGFFELETSGKNELLYRYAITSKFAFYLEAATPMLVNESFVSMAHLVQKYKLGIVFNNKEIDKMNQILDIKNEVYQEYVDNVKKFRENFTYKNNTKKIKEIFQK